ncbi:MAG: hypothetical protein EXS03_02065 [Phycisphaerales bacterium]|nr:hypothetical protein [Phycisphaerales bacterium]
MTARAKIVPALALALCVMSLGAQPQDLAAHWQTVTSNDGSWRIEWRLLRDSDPIQLPEARKRFTIELKIASTRTPADVPFAVGVDAHMPEHHHGMNVAPTVIRRSDGSLRAEGMLFHMSGKWEVDVDIDDGTTIERTQWDIGMY